MTDSRDHMISLIRMGLREIGDLDGKYPLDLTVGRGPGKKWYRVDWIRWLTLAFPELLEEPEREPYVVPDDLEGPETVPWLTARTMEGRTIEVWWQTVFTHEHVAASLTCLILLNQMGPYENRGEQPLTDWAKKATKRVQAELWNAVMERMGYTEDA